MLFQILRIIAVIALLIVAACLATVKGRLPLALRGIYRILHKEAPQSEELQVPLARRIIAFILVLTAATLAVL